MSDDGDTVDGDDLDGDDLDGDKVEDVEALRARLSQLEAENVALREDSPRSDRTHHRVRFTVAVALVVVASLLVPVSILGIWLRNQVTNTDRYVETMAPLARDPDIQAAATRRITDALFENVDVKSEVTDVLPQQAAFLAVPISDGLRTLATRVVTRVIESDRFAQLWDDANRFTHSQMVDVLTAEKAPKGAVVIDLSGVAKEATDRLKDTGISLFDKFGNSNRKLEFEIFRSDEVAHVQSAFKLFDRVATVLPWITVLMLVGAVFVFPNRRRGVVWAASGLALGAFLILVALTVGRSIYLDALPAGGSPAAAESVFDTLTRFLRAGTRSVVALGLVILVIALVMGPSGPAVGLRRFLSRITGRLGDEAGQHGFDLGPVGVFVHRNINALRIAVAVIAGAFLILGSQPTAATVLWVAIISLVVLAVIEVVGRAGAGQQPPTPPTGEPPAVEPPAGAATST